MEFFPRILTRDESDALAKRIRAQHDHYAFGIWAVRIFERVSFIGFVGLAVPTFKAHFTLSVEVGWRLDQKYWKHGRAIKAARRVMEYAFADLRLAELVSFTSVTNLRSQKLMLGFSSVASDDFEHPSLPKEYSLGRHVLY